jgi:hypothetical protein
MLNSDFDEQANAVKFSQRHIPGELKYVDDGPPLKLKYVDVYIGTRIYLS